MFSKPDLGYTLQEKKRNACTWPINVCINKAAFRIKSYFFILVMNTFKKNYFNREITFTQKSTHDLFLDKFISTESDREVNSELITSFWGGFKN